MHSNIYDFMGEHWFLTWCLAWLIWPILIVTKAVLTAPFSYPYNAYKARLRAMNIAIHGWPTAPLMNADGDIVHPPKEEKKS